VDSVGFATCSFRVEVLRPARTLPFKRFLAFGDSVTEGFLREPPDYSTALRPLLIIPTETYPYKLESMLRTRYGVDDIEVINAGAGGETVLEGRNRIVSELRAAMPDVVLILHGYNDVREIPTSDARDALRTIARAALNRGVEVVLATLFQVGDDREKSRPGSQKAISNLNDRIPGLASSLGLGGVADLELAFGFDRSLLGSDGLHPNPSGYQLIAEVMRDEIIRRFEGIPDAPAPPAPVDAGIVSTRPRQSISRSGH
jgi:acyl-CoA thioesterase-1